MLNLSSSGLQLRVDDSSWFSMLRSPDRRDLADPFRRIGAGTSVGITEQRKLMMIKLTPVFRGVRFQQISLRNLESVE